MTLTPWKKEWTIAVRMVQDVSIKEGVKIKAIMDLRRQFLTKNCIKHHISEPD